MLTVVVFLLPFFDTAHSIRNTMKNAIPECEISIQIIINFIPLSRNIFREPYARFVLFIYSVLQCVHLILQGALANISKRCSSKSFDQDAKQKHTRIAETENVFVLVKNGNGT